MSPMSRDPTERTFRVTMRDPLYERLYLRALEERMEPRALASALLERALRRWKPKNPPRGELNAIHERVGRAKSSVSGLLASKGPFAGRIDAEMKQELERIQGHLARVQDELKALREKSP
jgi:hypothetical protein